MMMMGNMGGSGGSMGGMGSGSMNMGMGMDMNMMGMDMMNMGGGSINSMAGMGNMSGMGNMTGMGNMSGMYPPGGYMAGGQNMPGTGAQYGADAMGGYGAGAAGHGVGTGGQGFLGFGNLDMNSLITGLLNFAVDIFAILLVVGLVLGAAVLIKKYVFDEFLGTRVNSGCTKCGYSLKNEWACCPKCGEAKATAQPVMANPQTA